MRAARLFWFGLLSFALVAAASAAERRKVIIDQDAFEGPGLQPILMLLQDPSVEVLGITVISGDGWQPEETAATLRMLELVGRTDVPVIAGATYPLVNSQDRMKRREALFGAVGYHGAWTERWPADNSMKRREPHAAAVVPPLPEGMPKTPPYPGTAADFLLAMTRKYPGEVSIVAMGPVTNLALAQRLDDGFAGRVQEVVVEGGNFGGGSRALASDKDEFAAQSAYAPRMSFNLYWDPEAAHIVFASAWPKLTLVTGDASAPAVGTRALLDRATASGRPAARYVAQIAQPGFPLWDEVQAAVWLDPGIVTSKQVAAMDVDLMPGANYGALLTWAPGKGPGLGERDVTIVFAIDVARANAMFVDLIGR